MTFQVDASVLHKTRRCVFWDFSLGGGFGDWSSEGCTLVSGPGENGEPIIECHCDHLTNFAILVVRIDGQHKSLFVTLIKIRSILALFLNLSQR